MNFVSMYVCMYVCVYIYIYVPTPRSQHAVAVEDEFREYVCMYVCMYVCIYVYIYLHHVLSMTGRRR